MLGKSRKKDDYYDEDEFEDDEDEYYDERDRRHGRKPKKQSASMRADDDDDYDDYDDYDYDDEPRRKRKKSSEKAKPPKRSRPPKRKKSARKSRRDDYDDYDDDTSPEELYYDEAEDERMHGRRKKSKSKDKNKNKKKDKKKTKKKITPADSVPYENVFPNGMIECANGLFSKSYVIPSINFKTTSNEKQMQIATQYKDFLSSFEDDVDIEITLYNKTTNEDDFERKNYIPMRGDGFDSYRKEFNDMLTNKMKNAKNNLQTIRILTVATHARDPKEADLKFVQIDDTVMTMLSQITGGKPVEPMSIDERLGLLSSIYNQDDDVPLVREFPVKGVDVKSFSLENCARQGVSTRDVIAPPYLEFKGEYGIMGKTFIKTFYVSNYPTWIKGTILTDFTNIPANMVVSVHFKPIEQMESIKLLRRQGVNIDALMQQSQKNASRRGYAWDLISPDLKGSHEEVSSLIDDMTRDNMKLFTVNFVCTIMGDSLKDLDAHEEQLKMVTNKNLITVKTLSMQQENGLDTVLPLGVNRVYNERMMTSDSIASIIPFDMKEINQEGGLYYGLNAVNRSMIFYNRNEALNPNSVILGMPGAGKSFTAKREMLNVILNTNDEIYIIDPEREYKPLADALGGTVIKIANGTKNYLNPFDLNLDNSGDDGDPIKVKSNFISTICNIMVGGKIGLDAVALTMIDRSVINIYKEYVKALKKSGKSQDVNEAPTMQDFYEDLLAQDDPDAMRVALSLERFVTGSLDIFSHHTNINVNNRFVVYDIKDIGSGLKEIGLQICLDNIWNKMIENHKKGKRTWIYIDEFYLMMQNESSAKYIAQIWKRARKWSGVPCAITQNVEDMLSSEDARTIINNCDFAIILGQSPINRQQLSKMFSISPAEQKFISSAKPGTGILNIAGENIPVDDTFPKDTQLYKIMTTKPEERL